MLDFLQVNYSPAAVVGRLENDVTAFKRPKPAQDFDPYTPSQRELVRTRLKEFLQSLQEETLAKLIELYLSQI